MRQNLIFVASMCGLLGGCPEDATRDDGAAAGEDGASDGRPADVCAAHIEWVERCQGQPNFTYTTEWGESECPLLPWRRIDPAFSRADAACLETLQCSQTDDDCADAGFRALGFEDAADIPDDPIFAVCSERAGACTELRADLCSTLIAFTADGLDAVRECFEQPCERIEDCVRE